MRTETRNLFGTTAIALILAAGAFSVTAARAQDASADGTTIETVQVTASRIVAPGFDAPTPTLVLSAQDISDADRPSIAEALDDLPEFRASNTPTESIGSTNSSAPVMDLRGLGPERTLTLLDGHRFIGANDLNTIPQSIVASAEVVTGGASAAWGSDAVAGVVNLIINDRLEGLTLSTNDSISSRADGIRYGLDGTYGTDYLGGRGHLLLAADYFVDEGLYDRENRFGGVLDAAEFTTAGGQIFLEKNVNNITSSPGGTIDSGPLKGMQFNPNGTLIPTPLGSPTNSTRTVGGGGVNSADFEPLSPPYHRINMYGRTTYEVSDALRIAADLGWTDVWDNFPSQPAGSGTLTFQSNNPYLTPAVQAQMAGGPSTFTMSEIFTGPEGMETLEFHRRTVEASVSASGNLGGTWSYDAYFDHGEQRQSQGFYNQAITANYNQALNAVTVTAANVGSSGLALGSIVCAVALTNPSTPCKPLDLFGKGNASPAAIQYAFAQKGSVDLTQTQMLTAAGFSIHGDPFSTWAGPVDVSTGADIRSEAEVLNYLDPLSASGALLNFDNSGTSGSFSVYEGFAEAAAPIVDIADTVKIDINGAARYSDYSTDGGTWSWKFGGTARLFNDLLLRTAYSQDIKAPDIQELFTAHSQANLTVTDPTQGNQQFGIIDYSGGNTALKQEIAHTLSIGGTYSPNFIPGLNMSLDYYDVDIQGAIATLSAQNIVTECALGVAVDCAQITRNNLGQPTVINNTYINLGSYKTNGEDIDISYKVPLANLISDEPGTITLESVSNYVTSLWINNGTQTYNYAGVVGDGVSFNVPHFRSIETIRYDGEGFGFDARVRYVGGGVYDSLTPIVNNAISARTYVDLGGYVNLDKVWTIAADVQNAFDVAPPFVTRGSPFYDEMGTYFTLRVKAKI